MRDNGVSVLEQYDFEVRGTRKTRGAVLCDTDHGPMLLKEASGMSGGVPVLYHLQQMLIERGYDRIDLLCPNREGAFISSNEDGEKYLVRRWFAGRECDIRSEAEVLEAAVNLAKLHAIMFWDETEGVRQGKDLSEQYVRHNRELKKIRSYIRRKPDKGRFETVYLRKFEEMYAIAEETTKRLSTSSCIQFAATQKERRTICHGDYNYHNLLITEAGMATVNFEHFYMGVQMNDLYYFLRKVLEKYNWKEKICEGILNRYAGEKGLSGEELEYLAVKLCYPEKFWKAANTYYVTNKAWISEKTAQKLEVCVSQQEKKKKLLKDIFCFIL